MEPQVSVIMATYNGARTIRASVNSILSQTLRDSELIVVDDCSTDDTLAVLGTVADSRLRIIRNVRNSGVVVSRNTALAAARAPYVAMLDHDDLSLPTRLAKQRAYLDAHPRTVLVGTHARTLENGRLGATNYPPVTTPALIDWLLHVANPLVCSSVMFRAESVRALGEFMRENYTYADDYDFYHRMAAVGDIARLDEKLTLYRLHPGNSYKKYEQLMADNAVKVLEPSYRPLFGEGAHAAAVMVVNHLSAGKPVASLADLRRLRDVFDTLNNWCLETLRAETPESAAQTRVALWRTASQLWRRVLRATAHAGTIGLPTLLAENPRGVSIGAREIGFMVADRLPFSTQARALLQPRPARSPPKPAQGHLFETSYLPRPPDSTQPPTLFVVVDTEAEFDWSDAFGRDLTAVTAMDHIERGQEIFDAYGLRPIYVIDYPVATQQRGYGRLRDIMRRDGCEIGAHLHPWTTPPFEEAISAHNSYPGNLAPSLEARKLEVLMAAIEENFGIRPVFYKAGRYGFGPGTAATLARFGIRIDLSVMPGADLRRRGGPDFTRLGPIPYRIDGTDILTLPMTRAPVGVMPWLGTLADRVQETTWGRMLHLPSILARLRLADTITLTPEGVTAAEQIRLVRGMLRQGARDFVLHYHSPSLGPGYTPYARDAAGAALMRRRLHALCRFFFEELGGLPGYPRDLLQCVPPGSCR